MILVKIITPVSADCECRRDQLLSQEKPTVSFYNPLLSAVVSFKQSSNFECQLEITCGRLVHSPCNDTLLFICERDFIRLMTATVVLYFVSLGVKSKFLNHSLRILIVTTFRLIILVILCRRKLRPWIAIVHYE